MCGIAGCYALREDLPPPELHVLDRMVASIRHRGPDEYGLYRDERVGLGHARLAIVDLRTGQQPMADARGSAWIVLNGEIYNHRALRSQLIDRGVRFRTTSDTEVLLAAYETWGEDAFERLRGQFAVAIWDAGAQTLVLARDRQGVRPLWLCEHAGRLWFASEVKALFAGAPSLPRRLDPVGLAETFTFWTTVAPQSVFEGVTELEPGHVRVVSRDGIRDRSYWSPRYPESAAARPQGSLEEAAIRLRALLEAAVRIRIEQADVPVGGYLSGGIDSSLVASLARDVRGGRFATYSIRFEDPEFDETAYQRAVVRHIESDHHEVVIGPADIAEVFPDVVYHAERPLLRTAPAPLFILSRLVHDTGVKVVLTGEGADEVFAGYDLFREARIRRFWGRVPDSRLRPRLLERLYPYMVRSPVSRRAMMEQWFGVDRVRWAEPGFGHGPRWRASSALIGLLSREMRERALAIDPATRLLGTLPEAFPRWSALAQDQYLETRTLLAGYLLSSQGDRMLMAHSTEGRFPFLDLEVVEFANSLPDRFKLAGLREKAILKRCARGLVPGVVIDRPKQPYRAPDASAFLGPFAPDWVDELTSERAVREAGVFDVAAVSRLTTKLQASKGDRLSNVDDMALVGVLSTGLIHERLICGARNDGAPLTYRTLVDQVARPKVPEAAGTVPHARL